MVAYPHTNTALSSQFHKQNGNAFRLDAKIKPTEARKHKLFETVEFQVTTGQIIPCARKGLVLIPIAKVAIYAMGKVEMYPKQELRQLQELKQTARKEKVLSTWTILPDGTRYLSTIKFIPKQGA